MLQDQITVLNNAYSGVTGGANTRFQFALAGVDRTTNSTWYTMAPGTQLDHKSAVLSFEEEVGYDPELDEPIKLGTLLASEHEDPAMEAARNMDWE